MKEDGTGGVPNEPPDLSPGATDNRDGTELPEAEAPQPPEAIQVTGALPSIVEGPPMLVSGSLRPDVTEKEKSRSRVLITVILIAFLPVTIMLAYAAIFTSHWSEAKELLQIVLPVETALLGSVVGYYFGAQKSGAEATGLDD